MASLGSSTTHDSLETLGNSSLPEFVNFDQKLSCLSCKKLLSEPMQLPCGHRLCKDCCNQLTMQSAVGTELQCPSQEEDCDTFCSSNIYPDYSAQREIRQLAVFCSYKIYGCPETMPWHKLKRHTEQCKFKSRICNHCRKEIPAESYQTHVDVDCREVPCSCPYGCGDDLQLKRHQLEIHKRNCRLKPQECRYKAFGCRFQGMGDRIAEHESDFKLHLETVVQHILSLNQQISSLQDSLSIAEHSVESLNSTVTALVKDNSLLSDRLQAFEKEFAQSKEHQKEIVRSQLSRLDAMNQVSDKLVKEFQLLRIKQSQQDTKIVELESSDRGRRSSLSLPEDMRQQFISHDRTIALHDMRLAELDLRFQCLQTANYEGVLIWKIADYQKRKQEAIDGNIMSLYSQPFYTGRYGYKMCGRVYLNGDGIGKGTHLSLFFVVMQGDYDDILAWPFRQKVTLALVDQKHNRRSVSDTFKPDPTSSSFQKPRSPMNVASGCPLFVKHSTLEDRDEVYLRNNTIYIKITVDTTDIPSP